MKRFLIFFIAAISLCTLNVEARKRITSQEECSASNQCYCSGICGFRDRRPDDNPVYVENDPYGNYCYCKPWDLEKYEERCNLKSNK